MPLAQPITRSCPYNCGETIAILHPLEGFQLMTCPRCEKPWVMETTMVPFVQVRTVEGYGITTAPLPTPEEIEQEGEYFNEHPEELMAEEIPPSQPWRSVPFNKRTIYRSYGEHVQIKYTKSAPVLTTWADIYMLCEEENPTSAIKELLGERANTNNVAAVNAFVRAVKEGKVSE